MKKIIKLSSIIILALVIICTPLSVNADSKNYIYNEYAEDVLAPTAYAVDKVVLGQDIGIGDFDAPADLFVDENDNIYIADSKNNRIVILDSNFNCIRQIKTVIIDGAAQELSNPTGVYMRNGLVYICDTSNSRAIAVNENNEVVRYFGMPKTSLLAEDFDFKPSKITVNSADTVFLVASGVYQGILQYNYNDEFIGFYGANRIEVTAEIIIQNIWKSIFSDAQRESLVRTIPTEYTNIFINTDDMILTATATAESKQIKMLNAAGENIMVYPGSSTGNLLQRGYNRNNFGDQKVNRIKDAMQTSQIVDVNIDEDNVIAVLDKRRGRVFLYDEEQNPLCIFGGSGNQVGNFKNAVAVDKCGTSYLVVDSDRNSITVFTETKYMSLIRSALREYSIGEYMKSAEYWDEVIKLNAGLPVAYKGVGRAKLINGEYQEAMEYLKTGDDRFYYSMAVQNFRREYVRENFLWLLPVCLIAVAAFVFGIKFLKKLIINSGKK